MFFLFFSIYILNILGGKENKKLRIWYILASVILALGELLVIISQFTGWLYYIDEHAIYHRGGLYWLSGVLGTVSLLLNAIVIFIHRKCLKPVQRTVLMLYIGMMVLANIASLLFYGISFILLASVVIAMIMLTALVNEQIELTKKSIKNKINYLLAVSMITLTFFLLAFISIFFLNLSSKNAETRLRESTESLALRLDNQLTLVEQAVNDMYVVSENFRPKIDELNDTDTIAQYSEQMEEIAISIANHTNGAVAVYYRMNPELTNSGTFGFFSVKSSETGLFEHAVPTDIGAYDPDDTEHVGWYYRPVQAGEPVWIEPYYNANIDIYMVSYVIPVYDGDSPVGVVGMDIDFAAFADIAASISVYESSGSALFSEDFSKIYYQKDGAFGSSASEEIQEVFNGGENATKLQFLHISGEKCVTYSTPLNNRMQLLTYASEAETKDHVDNIIVIGIAVFSIIFIAALMLSLKISNAMTKPLYDIMEATKQYAGGHWNAKIPCETEDEIGMLAKNIMIMADNTREYISQIRHMAKYDTLTGVRNRNDYLQHTKDYVAQALQSDGKLALIVMDVNNLKTVNDTMGHEMGDALLQNASNRICQMFSQSPVYRIGGDEFAVIVFGTAYDTVDEKMQQFHERMNGVADEGNIAEVCIASGMAKLGPDGDTVDAIFKAADDRMYLNKAELKNRTQSGS
ncbi:MAG: diguanylate cyclase [Acutalibacteraceae bacterium]|nr:diguanylate cyclase [Acutalibacteraceae bacterium]